MSQREQQNVSSSSGNPNAQASGDRLQSIVKEDEEVINLLSLGSKLIPDLLTRVGENLMKPLEH